MWPCGRWDLQLPLVRGEPPSLLGGGGILSAHSSGDPGGGQAGIKLSANHSPVPLGVHEVWYAAGAQ